MKQRGKYMFKMLSKIFIKDYTNTTDEKVRFAYGKLSGVVGIISNSILCVMKIILGFFIGSISIIADSINNLSDAGTSIITFVGFKLSSAPADKEHPFGHQRLEYIAGLTVSFIILFIGIILMKSSIENIISPNSIRFDIIAIIILIISILIKLWQSFFYKRAGKIIHSTTLVASAQDSLNDCLATGSVLVAYLIFYFLKINLDGYIGVLVSIFILLSGINLIRQTISPLIGEAPSSEFIQKIKSKILAYSGVEGIHDLLIHTYGPTKTFITVHVEVDSKVDILISHELVDQIEQDFLKDDGINLVIHMDPVKVDCLETIAYKEMILEMVSKINSQIDVHDFRLVSGSHNKRLIFDLGVPSHIQKEEEIIHFLNDEVKKIDDKVKLVITVDKNYMI